MTSFIKKLLLMLLTLCSISLMANLVKLDNSVKVVLDIKNPTLAEKTAVEELNTYLQKIFGLYSKNQNGTKIILRYSDKMSEEEFTITAKGKQVIIVGGRPRGVLFGAYYFLDRKLGVHWFTPFDEYVPELDSKSLKEFTYHGKPAIRIRLELIHTDAKQIRFAARNLVHRSVNNMKPDLKYGEERIFAPPLNCHGLHYIIPYHKYNLRNHPEFFAIINGKRVNPEVSKGATDYCLTNQGLIEATVKECRFYLKQAPESKYISIQEGDGTRGTCHCENCKALVAKNGNRESARWIYFANKVGEKLKHEFPKVKFLVFAYTASKLPPTNIKANDNVAVQFCMWGGTRGLAYDHPKNRRGVGMLKEIETWSKVCKNLLIWDYTYTFGDIWLQQPDMLLNIDNMKSFAKLGVDGVFCEDQVMDATNVHYGKEFRNWLLTRAMWNPDECNGEELEKIFCDEFYGPAGKYIAQYWKLLRETNKKQGFAAFTPGGSLGKTKFESPEITIQAKKILDKAIAQVKGNRKYYRRVYEATIPLRYRILIDFAHLKGKEAIEYKDPKEIVTELRQYIRGKSKSTRTWLIYKAIHRNLNTLEGTANIKATASRVYGAGFAAKAFDKSLGRGSNWHPGTGVAWVQLELDEKIPLNRITTVFCYRPVVVGGLYEVKGSFDGKSWYTIVPKQEIKADPKKHWVYCDVKLDSVVEARFIKTFIYRMDTIIQGKMRRQDALIFEQFYNLQDLPDELKREVAK